MNTQKSVPSYIPITDMLEKKKTEKQFYPQFTPRNKWIKPESRGVTKEVKYLYSKNFKTLQRN